MSANHKIPNSTGTLGRDKMFSQLSLKRDDLRQQVESAALIASRIEELSYYVATRIASRGVQPQTADAIAGEFFRRLATMVFAVDLHGSIQKPENTGAAGSKLLTWNGEVGATFLNLLRLSMPELLMVCMGQSLGVTDKELVLAAAKDDCAKCRARLVFLCSLLGPDLRSVCTVQSTGALLDGLLYWSKGGACGGSRKTDEWPENGWAAE